MSIIAVSEKKTITTVWSCNVMPLFEASEKQATKAFLRNTAKSHFFFSGLSFKNVLLFVLEF